MDSAEFREGDSLEAWNRKPEEWGEAREDWIVRTDEALLSIFSTGVVAEEFRAAAYGVRLWTTEHWDESVVFEQHVAMAKNAIQWLWSVVERIEYIPAMDESTRTQDIPAADESTPSEDIPAADPVTRTVFLVHGRNELWKHQVARTLETTGKHPVTILHEQPNEGRTLIEKFEQHAGLSGYAVVLLTGDDLAAPKNGPQTTTAQGETPKLEPRGRQNVVLELGFFFGNLGRENIAVLYEQGIELPSDLGGLVYIELDPSGAWKSKLLSELRNSGFDYDLNLLR